MNLDDDDSVFEQALRADLPTMSEQNRLRQRILAAGLVAGTALGSTNVAAAQAGFGASALSKLSALSWPAKFGLAAVLAAPIAALPLVSAPVPGAQIVSQVRSSARDRARSVSHESAALRRQFVAARSAASSRTQARARARARAGERRRAGARAERQQSAAARSSESAAESGCKRQRARRSARGRCVRLAGARCARERTGAVAQCQHAGR